jgi:hypothetical protein
MQTPFWTAKNGAGSIAIRLIVQVSPTDHRAKRTPESPEKPPSSSSHRLRHCTLQCPPSIPLARDSADNSGTDIWPRSDPGLPPRPPACVSRSDAASEFSAVRPSSRLRRPDRSMHFLRCVMSDQRRPQAPAGSPSTLRKTVCFRF